MLEKEATKERVPAFFSGRREIITPHKHAYRNRGGYEGTVRRRSRNFRGTGGEVCAAIFGDLYQLKLFAADLTVNFEWMRPWYLHRLPKLIKSNGTGIIDKGYQLRGGNLFAAEEKPASPAYPAGRPPSPLALLPPPLPLGSSSFRRPHQSVREYDHFYTMRRANDDVSAVMQCKIGIRNGYFLMAGTTLHYDKRDNNEARIKCDYMPLVRVIALQQPSDDLNRCMVDHADSDPLDNRAANLHWVTPSFNTLNMRRTAPSLGFFGVSKAGQRFKVIVSGVHNDTYSNAETAALVYNIIIRLKYGSQIDKTPHLFNQVGPDSRASKVWTDANGVDIYHVDKIFINVHNATVGGGVAYIPVKNKGKDVKIPLDDDSWKDIVARDAKLSISFGRPMSRDRVRAANVNFQWMRPWYMHHMPNLTKKSKIGIIEKAYRLRGDDRFAAE